MTRGKEAGTPKSFVEGLDQPRRSEVQGLHELIRKTPGPEPSVRSGMLA
jgi:hypothetical protein